MTTLSDQVTLLRDMGRTQEQIRQAMSDAFKAPASAIADYMDNDVRDIPGLLAGRQSTNAVDMVASTLPFVSREALTVPRDKPVAALDLPDSGEPEGAPPKVDVVRASGPIDKALQLAGAVGGATTAITATALGHADMDARAKLRGHISGERERKLEQDYGKTVFEDVGNIITGLPAMAIGVLGSFELEPGEEPWQAGYRAGEAIINAGVAAAQEAVYHPGDTVAAAPVSTLLNAIPAAMALSAAVKTAPAGSRLASLGLKADEGLATMRHAGGKLLTKLHPTVRQQWFDLFDAGDPRVSQFLEESLQGTEAKMSTAKREIPEMAKESADVRRAVDTPQDRRPFIDAADLDVEAEQAASRAAKAEAAHEALINKRASDRKAAAQTRLQDVAPEPPPTPQAPMAEPPLRPRGATETPPATVWEDIAATGYGRDLLTPHVEQNRILSTWGRQAEEAFAEVDEAIHRGEDAAFAESDRVRGLRRAVRTDLAAAEAAGDVAGVEAAKDTLDRMETGLDAYWRVQHDAFKDLVRSKAGVEPAPARQNMAAAAAEPVAAPEPPVVSQGPAPEDLRAATAAEKLEAGAGKKELARLVRERNTARVAAAEADAAAKSARAALPPEQVGDPRADAATSPARRRYEEALGTTGDADALDIGYPSIGEPLPSRLASDKRPLPVIPRVPPEAGAARDAAVDVRASLASAATEEEARNVVEAAVTRAQSTQTLAFADAESSKIPLWVDGTAPGPAIITMEQAADTPTWLQDVARSVGYQGRGRSGSADMSVHTVWQHIKDVQKQNPKAFSTYPQAAKDMASMRPVKIGDASVLASPQVAYAVETTNGIREANRLYDNFVWQFATRLGKTVKQVKLPLSVKSIVSNMLGNEFLTSIFAGRAPMQTAASGVMLAREAKKFWTAPAASRMSSPNARFFAAFDRTGVIDANIAIQELAQIEDLGGTFGQLGKGVDKLAELGGKAMAKGDEVAKLSLGKTSFDRATSVLDAMEPGTTTRVRTTPRTVTVVTRNADGTYTLKTPLREVTVPAGSAALDDVAAQWASFKTKSLYFDYGGDLPGWPRFIRESPAAANSPFYTWSFRALDIPFFKRGLGTAVLEGPLAGITTDSRAANAFLAGENTKVSLARGALLASMPNQSKDGLAISEAISFTNDEAMNQVVSATTNPGALSVARFSSSNWLGPDMDLWGGLASLVDRYMNDTKDELKDLGGKMAARSRAQREDAAVVPELPSDDIQALISRGHEANPWSRISAAVGLGGRITFETLGKIFDPKKSLNVKDVLADNFYPSTVKAVVDLGRSFVGDDSARLARAPRDEAQQADRVEFFVRQLFGIGWDTIDSRVALDRYTSGVTKTLNDQADQWYTKREAEIAGKAGDADEMRELYKLHGQIKGAISRVSGQATRNWVEAQRQMTRDKQAAVTPAQLRQKAAAAKLGGQSK